MKKALIATLAICFASLFKASDIYAEKLHFEISGNGSQSENQISSEQVREISIQQSNESNVENDVDVDANTGENNVSDNSGDQTQISTGDIETQTGITNQLNSSVVQQECCPQGEGAAAISGNGSNSTNDIDLTVSNGTDVTLIQEANIENNIYGVANTGRNTASDNSGDVTIHTGNIQGNVTIGNNTNNSLVGVNGSGSFNFSASISDNATDSINNINLSFSDNINIQKRDSSNIVNNLFWDVNTGDNSANGNLGDVFISTGDIAFLVDILNGPINVGGVNLGCCQEDGADDPPPTPTPPPTPQPPVGGNSSDGGGNGSSSNGDGSNSNGEVLGDSDGILPATGGDWLLLALLANIAMFLMGLYLRLRSGRSPSFK